MLQALTCARRRLAKQLSTPRGGASDDDRTEARLSAEGASKIHRGLEEGVRITPRSIEATEQLDARERARERERQRELVRARGNAGPGVGFSTPHKAEAGTTIRPAPWTDQTLRRAHTDSRSDFEADDVASPLFLRDPSQEAERYRLQAKANEFRR